MKRIFLVGFMGTGKTTFGRQLAESLGLSFIDTDVYIENTFHKSINQLFEEKGEEGFREIERKMLVEIAEMENVVIATGGGTACFYDNMDVMNRKGLTIYLKTPQEALVERLISAKMNRPLLRDKNNEEISNYVHNKLEEREPFYSKAQITINPLEEDITSILK